MGIFILNNAANPFNALDYKLADLYLGRGVTLLKLEGTIVLPARANGAFFFLYACANQDGSSPAVIAALSSAARPARDVVKLIGAIGTKPSPSTELIVQQQNDNIVIYNGSYTFDLDIGERSSPDPPGGFTSVNQNERGSAGAWPPGICAATLWRMEAISTDADGLAQVNAHGVDGTDASPSGPPARGMRTQAKAFTQLNEGGQCSDARLRLPIDPANDKIWVQAGANSKCFLLIEGYELKGNLQ